MTRLNAADLNPQLNPNYEQRHGYPQPQHAGVIPPKQGEPALLSGYPGNAAVPPVGYAGAPMPNNYVPPMMDSSLMGEDVDVKFFDFTNQTIRRNFIKKVYGILSCQLLFSLAVITFFIFCEPVKHFVSETPSVLYVALGVYLVLAIVLLCITEARRKAPLNYILLLLFTAATSYMLGVASATANVQEVMLAVGVTAVICLALTLFAFQTKYDFTMCNGFLLCAFLALLFLSIACAIYPSHALQVVYASLGIVLFSFSLVYHTQLMIGSKHKYAITPEEYVFAALTLYLDVINIFLRVLRLLR